MQARLLQLFAVLVPFASPLLAQDTTPDTEYAAMQSRGKTAMGVDQYASTHRFDALPDGGRIELLSDRPDSVSVSAIRHHLETVAGAFQAGEFSTPAFVHMQEVPGTAVMSARRAVISYRFNPLPQGGEVRITTLDVQALKAIHEFLSFQREAHHTGGGAH